MSISPTARQIQLLRFIVGFQRANGWNPSLEECGQAIGTKSKSQVCELMKAMEERGLIRRFGGGGRKRATIEVLDPPAIPSINGEPLYAVPLNSKGTAYFVRTEQGDAA